MQAPLHFILKFDMMPPYDQAYRRAADVLSCPSIMSVDSTIMSLDSTATDPGGGTIILCDTDEAIGRYKTERLPVIAVSHEGNSSEDLMGTPWLILSPEALTPEFLYEVYCRYYRQPMWILRTQRCLLRELCQEDFGPLDLLQQENVQNSDGCFFPTGCHSPEEFLYDYIRHQYPFFGFGIYAVLEKESEDFMGIAGFAGVTEAAPDGDRLFPATQDRVEDSSTIITADTSASHRQLSAEVSYALLSKYQHRGFAEEVLRGLIAYGRKKGGFEQFIARIRPENAASVALAKKCGIQIYDI